MIEFFIIIYILLFAMWINIGLKGLKARKEAELRAKAATAERLREVLAELGYDK